jgi:hypothetical protein
MQYICGANRSNWPRSQLQERLMFARVTINEIRDFRTSSSVNSALPTQLARI